MPQFKNKNQKNTLKIPNSDKVLNLSLNFNANLDGWDVWQRRQVLWVGDGGD